ncbi:MAG TPA: ABC transporter ATP-binding protein [Solirubrobacteraceae bacterium]|nr:ABC transporter ATP-binding protein [Solirubrobacteraceae bacterium]
MTLELRNLVKHYHVGDAEPVRAVDGVSLSIAPGELVALYGPSGSGKTTLLMLIAALIEPDGGAVLLDGRDLSGMSDAERSHYRLRELGFVDQTSDLLPGGNVVQNAAMKLWLLEHTRDAEHRIEPLLLRLGLGDRLAHRADQLSMGERQRVMIARALSTGPKLILADEPTGNLDTHRGREILRLLVEVCHEQDMSVLLATHDPQATAFADRVYALRDGRLVDYEPDHLFVPARAPEPAS